jgi:hypothetical protein
MKTRGRRDKMDIIHLLTKGYSVKNIVDMYPKKFTQYQVEAVKRELNDKYKTSKLNKNKLIEWLEK